MINEQLQQFLTGRIWLRAHTPFPREVIDDHVRSGHIHLKPGIETIPSHSLFQSNKHICNRCYNTNPSLFYSYQCAQCNKICTYCRHCIRMGRVSSCSELMTWTKEPASGTTKDVFNWNGQLTPLQQKASEELLASVQNNQSHLLHAVCGAGKTELLFPSCLLYTSPSPRDRTRSRMPSSA